MLLRKTFTVGVKMIKLSLIIKRLDWGGLTPTPPAGNYEGSNYRLPIWQVGDVGVNIID